jgi:DNA-binding response OmpR family regulator
MNVDLTLLKHVNALYLEDDKDIQVEYVKLFSTFFKNLYIADNPIDGLDLFKKKEVRLVITDIKMPHMSGIEFAKKIREIDKNVPIFVMSAFPEQADIIEAVKLNFVDFMIKPVSYAELKNTLRSAVDRLLEKNMIQVAINDDVTYDPLSKCIHSKDGTFTLTNKEALLLEYFIANKGRVISRTYIEDAVYDGETMSDSALKNLLLKLRKKLPGNYIQTVKNSGYTFSNPY